MANPLLNEKSMADAAMNGWGAPDHASRSTPIGGAGGTLPNPVLPNPMDIQGRPPISDGPTSGWSSQAPMTIGGTITATGVLMVVLIAFAVVGWNAGGAGKSNVNGFPVWALVCIVAGFVLSLVVSRKPMLAKFLAPVYAVVQGYFVGVISSAYNVQYNGIVVQAIGATLAVFVVMLVLFRTRIIKVTDRLRGVVMGATMGLMLFYGVSLILRLILGANSVSFLNNAGPIGILFSVLAAGLAAFNLLLDFDMIEKGAEKGWPKGMEWFCAFGLLVTIVWLYLELLRLLSKLQRNN